MEECSESDVNRATTHAFLQAVFYVMLKPGDTDCPFDPMMSSNGDDLKNISNHPPVDAMANWSPDGQSIVFISNRDGSFDLFVIDQSGRKLHKLEQ